MATKQKNKIIWDGDVLIDLTADTVTADKLLYGYTAHDMSGTIITGSCTYDSNTQDATVQVAEILSGKTAYARGTKLTGSMTNNGAVTLTVNNTTSLTIPQGYHDGSGKVSIASTELAKLVAGNIKEGITILGVKGSLKPSSSVTVMAKTVTPTSSAQTVLPDTGTDYLSQVTVNAIPYVESENSAGGITVTIG